MRPKQVSGEWPKKDDRVKCLPNFFLVGAPKCGTTAIAFQLGRHPDVFVSNPKEPNYFMYKGENPYRWESVGQDNEDWYLSLFDDASDAVAVGEASAHYLIAEHVAREIRHFNPEAQIIVVLRNSVYRAFSMYRYWHRNELQKPSVKDFLNSFYGEKLGRVFEANAPLRIGWLKDASLYMKHVNRYLEEFNTEQISITFYADLVKDSRLYFEELFVFLGVDPAKWKPNNTIVNQTEEPILRNVHHFIWNPSQSRVGKILKNSPLRTPLKLLRKVLMRLNSAGSVGGLKFPDESYQALFEYYSADVAKLEALVGRDLSGWRDGSML